MILRTLIKTLMIVTILFVAIAYLAYLRTGTFWLPSFSKVSFSPINKPSVMQSLPEMSQPAYKWRKDGNWVYGDNPPTGVTPIKINKNTQ